MATVNVTQSFQSLLKTLCLAEFPCGNGPWRKQVTVKKVSKNYGKQYISIMDKTEPSFAATLNDYDASKMHIETLQEFVAAKHSPWTSDYSWSEEARSLRELGVKSPELLSDDFIHQHFKTLRLTDKNIEDVDELLLKFTNLEHLTLSANYIRNVNSKNLPRRLLSLELNSNQVSELFSLCVDPPELVHLGLGSNCLTYVDDYLSGEHWPALLSLDLSYNDLTDLTETLRKLKTLPNLRNLILMGNPLMLTPGYRGFVIDNLSRIDLLDDQRIEADERHKYTKMSKLSEQELCQCIITFGVGSIKNLPVPLEIQNPEEQPEYPIITRNYYLEFHYIDQASQGMDIFAFDQSGGNFDFDDGGLVPRHMSRQEFATPQSFGSARGISENPPSSVNMGHDETFFTAITGGNNQQFNEPKKPANVIQSDKAPWSENVELNWQITCKRDDLLAVRDFLKQPMKVNIVEETILSYPKEEEEVPTSAKGKKKDPDANKKDDKKGKKKKDMENDMRHEPPELSIMASFECDLQHFLTGEYSYTKVLSKSGAVSRIPSSLSQRTDAGVPKKDAKKPNHPKDGGKGKETERKKSGKDKDGKKDAANQGKRKPQSKSSKKKGKNKIEIEVDPNEPPPVLQVDLNINMHYWSSTTEAFQVTAQNEE